MANWSIPDWATVLGFLWAVAATICGIILKLRKRDVSVDAENFLLGLKASANPKQEPQINDQLARIKKKREQWL